MLQEVSKQDQDALEEELATHRDSILKLSDQSLDALDVLVAIARQFVGDKFGVVDPSHFVNYLHGILCKGDPGFDSFRHASQVHCLISARAASEVAETQDLPWSDIVAGRIKTCREAADISRRHLIDQLVWEFRGDVALSKQATEIAQHAYDRAIAYVASRFYCIADAFTSVLDFKEQTLEVDSTQRRVSLARLHAKSTDLNAKRDAAIQCYHLRRDFLEHGNQFH
jgi:hypothetical protein